MTKKVIEVDRIAIWVKLNKDNDWIGIWLNLNIEYDQI
jgi:hypothetical protein